MTVQKSIDNRRARSVVTKDSLMRAAEKLIAINGVENVSIRDIVAAAGQKNESALQYHFNNLTGLVTAIHCQRSRQIRRKRQDLLTATQAKSAELSLRQLCALMVEPVFLLARSSVDFRHCIKAFGHEPALTETPPLGAVSHKGGSGETAKLISK